MNIDKVHAYALYMNMIIGMEYHIQQVPMHFRVCGLRLKKTREKPNTCYHCKVFSAELKIAFSMDTSGNDARIHQKVSASVASILCRETLAQSQRGCITSVLSSHFSGLSVRKKECKVELLLNHIHVCI